MLCLLRQGYSWQFITWLDFPLSLGVATAWGFSENWLVGEGDIVWGEAICSCSQITTRMGGNLLFSKGQQALYSRIYLSTPQSLNFLHHSRMLLLSIWITSLITGTTLLLLLPNPHGLLPVLLPREAYILYPPGGLCAFNLTVGK